MKSNLLEGTRFVYRPSGQQRQLTLRWESTDGRHVENKDIMHSITKGGHLQVYLTSVMLGNSKGGCTKFVNVKTSVVEVN